MQAQLREIRLYGELGRRFGRVHHFAVQSTGEAIRALMANFRDFEHAMVHGAPGYKVWQGAERIGSVDEIHHPCGSREIIRIAPVVVGAAKSGWGRILIGAVLIAASIYGGPQLAAAGYGFIATAASSIGVSLILGGVAQLLTKQPDFSPGSEEAQKSPSYVFNGAVNTTAQGHPVPIGYGRLRVGSAVISVGVATEDIPV